MKKLFILGFLFFPVLSQALWLQSINDQYHKIDFTTFPQQAGEESRNMPDDIMRDMTCFMIDDTGHRVIGKYIVTIWNASSDDSVRKVTYTGITLDTAIVNPVIKGTTQLKVDGQIYQSTDHAQITCVLNDPKK